MSVILYICRILGGAMLMLLGGAAVILAQRESYKKPKILRKRLTYRQKVLKRTLIYMAITGGLGWVSGEYNPIIGLIFIITGTAISVTYYVLKANKHGSGTT